MRRQPRDALQRRIAAAGVGNDAEGAVGFQHHGMHALDIGDTVLADRRTHLGLHDPLLRHRLLPELALKDVTVVDQAGRLLSRPSGSGGGLDGTQLEYVREVERVYRQRIEMLTGAEPNAAHYALAEISANFLPLAYKNRQ